MLMAAATDSDYFTKQIISVRVEVKTHFSTLIDKLRQREAQLLNELDVIEKDHQKDKEVVEGINKIMLAVKTNNIISNELTEQLAKYDAQSKVKSVRFVCSSEWEKQISNFQLYVNRVTEPIDYNAKFGPQIIVRGRDKEEGQVAESYNYYSAVSKTHQYSGVAIDPITNNIYLADYINSSVSVYNDTGVYLFEFGSDNNKNVSNDCKMNCPNWIACYNDTLFISQTRSHCILVYKVDGTLISKFGSYGSNYGQLNNPLGLAICSTTGDIYVCDSSNCRVAVFDSDFKHKTNFSRTLVIENIPMGTRNASLNSPHDVKLTIDKIFVLDSNKMCVHVYNLRNKQCTHSFISCGNNNRRQCGENNSYITGSASFIAIDKDDNIIISDSGTDSVKIFTKEGKFFHQIGGSTTAQLSKPGSQLISPGAVAIDNKNRLVIANNDPAAIIQIY